MPPPPPPPAQEENLKDEEEVVDVFYEADNTARPKNKDAPHNPIFDSLKGQLEINASTAMQLQKVDEEQRQTLADLQFYA